ncbi:LacI family DNA-binding transcriptional regulator [Bifidobacterium sp. ESL0682]|uniref:LacI family DNA-binding transcriptional regulator n=1 Tax=Bifidobacterium sp. ESL0682 TaxID=2983212 RepID=UPI0023FA01B1|nr:LacI family DNA-binding transcriptional regulator [Bifidobacterium sp. ESL0682]WEV41834.1 LacI family DNA-binding transcriptional regulator [Bifidobacterium sp. ESL0682]
MRNDEITDNGKAENLQDLSKDSQDNLQDPHATLEDVKKPVTIRDVAQAAGVVPSTVSRAFARPGRVSAATAEKIYKVADRLGYRSHTINAHTNDDHLNGMLGIVVADLSNPVFAEYTRAAQHECLTNGFGLLVLDSEENTVIERTSIHIAGQHIDGIILASSRLSDTGIRKLAQTKPLVTLNRSIRGIQSVIAEVQTGLTQAINHLVTLGHRSFTYLSGPESSWQDGVRWRTLSSICLRRHLKLRRIPANTPTFSGGFGTGNQFLSNPTDAVIAYNDIMAIGFIAALHSKDVSVPDDVSVVGIDDVQFSSLVSPALSTVRLPRKALGVKAVTETIGLIRHTKPLNDRKPIMLESSYIVRASTGKVNPSALSDRNL